jgi:hypothetical protein
VTTQLQLVIVIVVVVVVVVVLVIIIIIINDIGFNSFFFQKGLISSKHVDTKINKTCNITKNAF